MGLVIPIYRITIPHKQGLIFPSVECFTIPVQLHNAIKDQVALDTCVNNKLFYLNGFNGVFEVVEWSNRTLKCEV